MLPAAPLRGLCSDLRAGFLPTRKRVLTLDQTMLIDKLVVGFLFPNILNNCRLGDADCADKIALAPKMTIPIFVFQIGELLEYHEGTLAL